jgi:hypothetical protein
LHTQGAVGHQNEGILMKFSIGDSETARIGLPPFSSLVQLERENTFPHFPGTKISLPVFTFQVCILKKVRLKGIFPSPAGRERPFSQ